MLSLPERVVLRTVRDPSLPRVPCRTPAHHRPPEDAVEGPREAKGPIAGQHPWLSACPIPLQILRRGWHARTLVEEMLVRVALLLLSCLCLHRQQ